jgi:hypothetical protein
MVWKSEREKDLWKLVLEALTDQHEAETPEEKEQKREEWAAHIPKFH